MPEVKSNDSLYSEIVSLYLSHNYQKASKCVKTFLSSCVDEGERTLAYIDLSHLLCLSGQYEEAQPILKRLVDDMESSKDPNNDKLEKLYLMYANCLFNHKDYIRFHYYIHKYLNITKTTNPYACSFIKKMLSEE